MVTDASGNKVTLFESLRKAIREIVNDKRLIKKGSRVSFITFGTVVEEKKSWPSQINGPEDRSKLIALIEDKDSLKADRIGDTYMGGALNLALGKAEEFCASSDPCTTTFILMLTDGWDEPPKDAKYDVRDVAKQVVEGQNATQVKVGIDTWQIAVIGLKSLPKIKEGTTTAVEVASLLNGTFLDVTQEKGSSVSKKIYKGLSKILLNQRGELNLVGDGKVVDFGEIDGNGKADTSIDLELRACDKEEITSIKVAHKEEISKRMQEILASVEANLESEEKLTLLSEVPDDAITLKTEKESYLVEPVVDETGKRFPKLQKLNLELKAGSSLPVGKYLGCFKLVSSAKVPACIPFIVSAPARLTIKGNEIDALYKRKGFFSTGSIKDKLTLQFAQAKGSQAGAVYKIKAVMKSPVRVKRNGKPMKVRQELPAKLFNNGNPIEIVFDTNEKSEESLEIDFSIPSKTHHGIYKGVIELDIDGPPEMVAPKEVPITITVKASDWEQVAPIAIPMFLLLIFGIFVYAFYWLKSHKR